MDNNEEYTGRQHPINSGFDGSSTIDDVLGDLDFTGRTALVTGGYSGLGLATTQALAARGARVIVPARRTASAQESLQQFPGVQVIEVDLADLSSVAAAAREITETGQQIDLAVFAAGVMASPEVRVGDQWELQFATNHLGHFALFGGLAKAFSAGARVISYSSAGHFLSGIRWADPHFHQEDYHPWLAYAQSKTANALFALQLAELGADRGISAYSLHPGNIMTPLQRHIDEAQARQLGWVDAEGNPTIPLKSPEQGAATGLWAATTNSLSG